MTLKISWGNDIAPIDQIAKHHGFGSATRAIVLSLRNLGYSVEDYDSSADVHFHFSSPSSMRVPREGMYTIVYFPWESTELLPNDDLKVMQSVDEVWTPSPVVARWFEDLGLTNVHVFQHGVEPIWEPKKRNLSEPFTFLHLGSEAARKGGLDAIRALRLAFPTENVRLNMKVVARMHIGNVLPRVNIINKPMSPQELVQLFYDNHVYVLPSYGEGFGLPPLQALATGMPTITLPAWAPYKDFIHPDLAVDSELKDTPWPEIHPGKMFHPSMDSLIESMRNAYNNYDAYHKQGLEQVEALKSFYSWDRLTKEAFEGLEKRINLLP